MPYLPIFPHLENQLKQISHERGSKDGFLGFSLRNATLIAEQEFEARKNAGKVTFPMGEYHANDGVYTVDGFQWGLKMSHWFVVRWHPSFYGVQIMSWSRLAKALAFVDREVPAARDGGGEDDINYTGPTTPTPDPVYELTWKDKRAHYDEHSLLSKVPRLAHPLRLPEVITTHTEPIMFEKHFPHFRPPEGQSSHYDQLRVYHRVYPPPRLLFEHERLHADVFYSKRRGEKVGWGHSSEVYRVRMEHPDLSCELKETDEPECEKISTEDVEMADPINPAEFEPHSPAFYAALLTARIHEYRWKNPFFASFRLRLNVDPNCSDDDYDRKTRDEGHWGIPWSAIQVMWEVLRKQEKERDDLEKEETNPVGAASDPPTKEKIPFEFKALASTVQSTWEVLKTEEEERDELEKEKATAVGTSHDAASSEKITPSVKTNRKGKGKAKATARMETETDEDEISPGGKVSGGRGKGVTIEEEKEEDVRDKIEEDQTTQEQPNRTLPDSALEPLRRFIPQTFNRSMHNQVRVREICEPDGTTLHKEETHYVDLGNGRISENEAVTFVEDEFGRKKYGYVRRQRHTPRQEIVEQINCITGEVLESDITESQSFPFRKEMGHIDESNGDAWGSESLGTSMSLGQMIQMLYGRQERWFNDLDPEPPTIREREFRVQRIFDGIIYEFDKDAYTRVTSIISGTPSPAPPPVKQNEKEYQKIRLPVALLAKLPYCTPEGRYFVENEGETYGRILERFPWLMEGTKGFIQTKPIHQPMPAAACVPRFYGMYRHVEYLDGEEAMEIVEEDEQMEMDGSQKGTGSASSATWRPKKVSYMLLLEECGVPVVSEDLESLHKTQIMSQLRRIHRIGILQNSPSVRNIVIQPGPLHLPPSSRSLKFPSFRIIDFGRGEYYPKLPEDERLDDLKREPEFYERCLGEEETLALSVDFGPWIPYANAYTDGLRIRGEDDSVIEEWP